MKPFCTNPRISIAIVVLVAAAVLFAGCASQPAAPAATTPAPTATAATATLPYGVTIAVPSGWTREDLNAASQKDYNRSTVTIARFTSPVTAPGNAASANVLTVDFDPSPATGFEDYFNQATLALQETYNTGDQGMAKSSTLTISGNKAYELDFQSREVKGSYIFVSTEKGMYIFAFRGQNQPIPVRALEGEIMGIINSIRINP